MSRKRGYFNVGTLIPAPAPYGGRFRVLKKVLPDSDVYFCEDGDTNDQKEVVVKIEMIGKRKTSRLDKEWNFYERLKKYDDFNIVLHQFIGIDHRFLILKKRGIDLRTHYKRLVKAGQWTDRHLNEYAVQMVASLEKCHSLGIIHLDPKPNNFVLDQNNEKRIYLIDFDVSKLFRSDNGEHIPFRNDLPFDQISGNRAYLSLNGHKCEEQSRRDDMDFLGYSLVWMSRNGLPWNYRQTTDFSSLHEFYEYIREEKMRYSVEDLCVNTNNNKLDHLVQYMKYCRELKFSEEPNYSFLISLFDAKESVDREAHCL